MNTPHDGEKYQGTPHQSLLLQSGRESVFLAGDAILEECQAAVVKEFLTSPLTAVFVNVYQVYSRSGRAFLRSLRPQRIFLYHLPLENDDKNGYHSLAENAVEQFPQDLSPLEIPEHLRWIDRRAAQWRRPELSNGGAMPPRKTPMVKSQAAAAPI